MLFSQLSLSEALIKALPGHVQTATKIQASVIPPALTNKDVLALAQTGSGKTLAFGLSLIEQIEPSSPSIQAIVLVPTRELANQVSLSISEVADKLNIKTRMLCGGIDKEIQIEQLVERPNIIVATTGRLLDLIESDMIDLSDVKTLVLDEADRLLDMGFWPDIQKLLPVLPKQRQTLLFSATLPTSLENVVKQVLFKPVRIEVHSANSVVDTVEEKLYLVNKGSKPKALISLLQENGWDQVLVFIGAKDNADALTKKLTKAGVKAEALHGNKGQEEREKTLTAFKNKQVQVLVATDVLARGIHIDFLPIVINFELPSNPTDYVHRVGRTARAGNKGLAYSLVCHGEADYLTAIRQLTLRELPLEALEGFQVTDKPTTGEQKRPPRDKQANRRTAKKKSVKQFKSKPNPKVKK